MSDERFQRLRRRLARMETEIEELRARNRRLIGFYARNGASASRTP